MDLQKIVANRLFELVATDSHQKIKASVIGRGRSLIGRSESCDIIINHDAISAIHSVIEVREDKIIIYDMNSTNGTYLNDEKIVVKEVALGDKIRLADFEMVFQEYDSLNSRPAVLDTLDPGVGAASPILPSLPETPKLPVGTPPKAPSVSDKSLPAIIYPLTNDPKAELSEYIFEDKNDLYPIFKYESSKQAVEVIILFKEQILSVDYLPAVFGTYYMSGVQENDNEVEFPFLKRSEKLPFIDIRSGSVNLQTLPGYDVLILSDQRTTSEHVATSIHLLSQDIVRLTKGDLQIYVRQVQSPPQVAMAPILKRDPEFKLYLFLGLIAVILISVGIQFLPANERLKYDEDFSAPEKLSSIYKSGPQKSLVPRIEQTAAPDSIVIGSIAPGVVRDKMMDFKNQFASCHQGSGTGDLRLRFVIGASGHVISARTIGKTTLPAETTKCVLGVLRGIHFQETLGASLEFNQKMKFPPLKK